MDFYRQQPWILTVPVYCQSDQLRAVEEVLDKVRSRHTEVLGSCVAYTFRPGAGWLDVYRKPEPRKAGASESA